MEYQLLNCVYIWGDTLGAYSIWGTPCSTIRLGNSLYYIHLGGHRKAHNFTSACSSG